MIIDILLFYCCGRGGVETVCTKIHNILEKKGHTVRILQAQKAEYDEFEKNLGEIYYFGEDLTWSSSIYEYSLNYKKLVSKIGKPDVVIATHEPCAAEIAYLALNKESPVYTPIISWMHAPLELISDLSTLNYCNAHFAISSKIKDGLSQEFNPENVYLIGNPVTIKNNPTCKRPSDGIKVVYVGRFFNHQKRIDILLNALSKVKGKWSLQIIGDGADKAMLKSIAVKLNIDKNITWNGWLVHPWKSINEASILISTSDFEPFGVSQVEALSRGIPVISTRTGGTRDIIKDGINGWLIDKGDSDQLAHILNSILDGSLTLPDPDSCKKSVEKFDDSIVADKFEKVILSEVYKKQNKKIVDIVLFNVAGHGGTESNIINLSNGLKKLGYRIRLIQLHSPYYTSFESSFEERYYYGLQPIKYSHKNSIEIWSMYYKKLLDNIGDPDIMIAAFVPQVSYMCKLTSLNRNKNTKVISLINVPIDEVNGRNSVNYADYHIATSKFTELDLKKSIPDNKICYINKPVKLHYDNPCKRSESTLKLLFIGRLDNSSKRVDIILNALSNLHGNWHLDILGDGPDKQFLIDLSNKLNINNNITFHGWIDDPWSYVHEASILLLTSDAESMPLAILESLSRGIPVICTKSFMQCDVIQNNINGWLIDKNNPKQLADLLNNIQVGNINLPTAKQCTDSIKDFDENIVFNKLNKYILQLFN